MKTRRFPLHVALAAALMMASFGVSKALTPTVRVSDIKPKIVLGALFPAQFGEWREVQAMAPVLPDPSVQATLDATYSQTLSRVYVDPQGQIVMLTVAYGNDQNSEATAAHRPEFCYTANGFTVRDMGVHQTALPGRTLTMSQLLGVRGEHHEPISYWVTLDESATLPGFGRKLTQMRYGLQGKIADGMLVRVSSLSRDTQQAFALHDRFLRELFEQVPPGFRSRVFGS